MIKDRLDLYKQLEIKRNSKLIVYFTSTRQGLETQIANDILPIFTEHFDKIGDTEKISLFLYTNGGNTLTAWSLVNLIRSFCKNFEVIIPSNCFSSGTLISLGADNIIMTKQATLGPIDPSVNGPLNPGIPGINDPNIKVPVSVEYVNAYLEMAKNDFGITDQDNLTKIMLNLSEKIHPLTLGQVYKSKSQIQMLAKKLLSWQKFTPEKEDVIIKFLCSDSGSHDYSIRRSEAVESLGLNVEKPDMDLYKLIKSIFDSISSEMELESPFNPSIMGGVNSPVPYSFRRCLIESIDYGTDVFLSQGEITKQQIPTPQGIQNLINDTRTFEGWKHEII
ncbi:MAG: SDH family Clp fold serine proteinase [Paludibacteraceae bacterium]